MSEGGERQARSSTPYNDYLSKAERLGLSSCPAGEVRRAPPPLTAPSLLSRAGLRERKTRSRNYRTDITEITVNVTGNTRSNNNTTGLDNYPIVYHHHQPQPNIEDVFKPMWSWYYGGQQPTRDKIGFPGEKKPRQRSNSTSSLDLTEALDPEWYFRDTAHPDPKGILKSPGKIKQVGFGKNKVAFLDFFGAENNGRQL